MAKAKKITRQDVKNLFEKTKKSLQKLGKETSVWMKKGEAEISRISKIGKLEIDIVNLNMKKEKLFRNIGRRVVEQNLAKGLEDSALKDMCEEAKAALSESKRKSREVSRIGKDLLKGKAGKK